MTDSTVEKEQIYVLSSKQHDECHINAVYMITRMEHIRSFKSPKKNKKEISAKKNPFQHYSKWPLRKNPGGKSSAMEEQQGIQMSV